MRGQFIFASSIPIVALCAILRAQQPPDPANRIQRIPLEDASNRPRPQQPAAAPYFKAALSVYRVTVNDAKGARVREGIGFSVDRRKLIATLIPEADGSAAVDTIAGTLPAKIEQVDARNGISLLTTARDLPGTPLQLSSELPRPGELLYSIGNLSGPRVVHSAVVLSVVAPREGKPLITVSLRDSMIGPLIGANGKVAGLIVDIPGGSRTIRYALPAVTLQPLAHREAASPQ